MKAPFCPLVAGGVEIYPKPPKGGPRQSTASRSFLVNTPLCLLVAGGVENYTTLPKGGPGNLQPAGASLWKPPFVCWWQGGS